MSKKMITAALICLPLLGIGQCVKCTSFAEAEKEPAKAVSIKMNARTTDDSFEEIPDLSPYVNLETLYLSDFGFPEIPASIGKLTKLRELSFAGNELEGLPEELFQLKQLKELILFGNAFSDEYKAELQKRLKKEMPDTKLMID